MTRFAAGDLVRRGRHLIVALTLGGMPVDAAWACSCFGFASFDEVARSSETDVVVVGRVLEIGPDRRGTTFEGDPTYVDVEVTWVARGRLREASVRIWNLWAGTSCGGEMSSLERRGEAVFAVQRADAARRRNDELWDALELSIPARDYVATVSCGEDLRRLTSGKDRARYVGRRIR